jgi:hypothetical protein
MQMTSAMRYLAYIATLGVVAGAGYLYYIEPRSYDDCILRHAAHANSRIAVTEATEACRNKFPEKEVKP